MSTESNNIVVPEAPAIPGLQFRHFRGPEDYPVMVAIIDACKVVDKIEHVDTVETLTQDYEHLINSDPRRDMLFVEVAGAPIGYSRVMWEHMPQDKQRVYQHFAFLVPAWRGRGIWRTMLRYNERRLREIAAGHAGDAEKLFEAWAADTESAWRALLESEGYGPVRYGYEMVRPHLEDIPDLPLPAGIDVRPSSAEQFDEIIDAAREAFLDHWGFAEDEWGAEARQEWRDHRTFNPALWQVAWDGDEIAGMVLNFIDEIENTMYHRQRGYTETICVRRPWRKRGLARALIARSFGVLKAAGMTEAGLGVDAQNPHGALRLYESMGFQVTKEFVTYRKALAE